jgi:hypothetical protein
MGSSRTQLSWVTVGGLAHSPAVISKSSMTNVGLFVAPVDANPRMPTRPTLRDESATVCVQLPGSASPSFQALSLKVPLTFCARIHHCWPATYPVPTGVAAPRFVTLPPTFLSRTSCTVPVVLSSRRNR